MSGDNIDEYKNNEDYPGMEESLVPDFDYITNPNKKSDVTIDVVNPQQRDEKFSKYFVYTIEGKDKEGGFKVERRYKDFERIRAVFVARWPGCYIPPLPPKSVTSKQDSKFIEERRRQLQIFCKKVADLSHLHYSEEYKIFIRSGNPDLEKTFAPMLKTSNEDIIQRYKTNFAHLSSKELNNDTAIQIQQFKVFLQKTQGHFESFKKVARSVAIARRNYYEKFAAFHSQVCTEYEKNVFSEYHNSSNGKNIFSDPTNFVLIDRVEKIKAASSAPSLEYLYEWIKIESREIEAFIEAINQRDKYEIMKTKNQEKQKSDTYELQKVLAGKTTLKGLFSRKPKEDEAARLEQNINAAGKEMENLILLYDMITLLLAHSEIQKFKANKLSQYYHVVKLAAQNELGNVKHMVDYWKMIAQSENIKLEN